MKNDTVKTILLAGVGYGLALSGLVYLGIGLHAAIGALAGTAVSVLNFAALAFIAARIFAKATSRDAGDTSGVGGLAVLMMVKLGFTAALCYLLIVRHGVDAIGFAVGCGGIILSVITVPLLVIEKSKLGEER